MFFEIFDELPIAYDMGIDIKTIRKRKKHRKGSFRNKKQMIETVVITSKEMADISGELLARVLKRNFSV